jgi:seryl-tRNA synthetase
MIDLKKFRQDPTPWKESAKKRGLNLDFDYILKLDEQVRDLKNQLNNLLAERKKLSAQIPQLAKE